MEPILNYCEACSKNEATTHVTLEVRLVNLRGLRTKIVQFWLCDRCEKMNRIFLENRSGQRGRAARAMTPTPAWWRREECTTGVAGTRLTENDLALMLSLAEKHDIDVSL